MNYLDLDRKLNMFVIKETITSKVLYTIPKGLMDMSDDGNAE